MMWRWLVRMLVLAIMTCGSMAARPRHAWGATGGGASATGSSVIGVGDTLRVKVKELASPGKDHVADAVVNELGDVKVLFLGAVHVAGLTPAEAEERIGHAAVTAGYLRARTATNPGPQVAVTLVNHSGLAGKAIGYGDTLEFRAWGLVRTGEDFVMEVQVNETGDVRVPKVGMVRVLGLTPAQAEDKIGQQAVAGKFLVPKKDGSPGAVLFVRMLKQAEGNVLAPIGPGDRLQVRAFELMTPGQEYVTEVRVDEVGDIKLYGVGRMHVADLTTTLVEEKVGQLAVAGHLLAPKSATDPGPQVFARMLEKAKPGAAAVVAGVLPKVGVADTLAVNVYELVAPGRDYAVELQVDGGGKIKLRNLERMEVGGLTTVEIEEKIAAEAVKAGFLMAKGEGRLGPQVIVTLVRKAAEGERPATLRAGDRLQIEGFGLVNPREFYSATVTVDEAGDIEIPNVGTERVAGMMPWQVEEKIVEMAVAGGFLPKGSSGPIVNVTWLKKAATATTVGADDRP